MASGERGKDRSFGVQRARSQHIIPTLRARVLGDKLHAQACPSVEPLKLERVQAVVGSRVLRSLVASQVEARRRDAGESRQRALQLSVRRGAGEREEGG